MQANCGQHAGEEVLERYSMGTLQGAELESFEEHLLICPACQERLEETDAYIQAMRTAAAKLRNEPALRGRSRRFRWVFAVPKPVWAAVSVLLLLLLSWVAGLWRPGRQLDSPPVAVVLQSARGETSQTVSQAPSGKVLLLEIDLAELPNLPSYELEIVDARGSRVWHSTGEPDGGRIQARVSRRLGEGTYWVRLCRPGRQKELLREFGLRLR